MATVSSCAGVGGRLISIKVDKPAPMTIALSYDDGSVDIAKIGVAVEVSVSQQIAAQFQNALNDAIFVTPFGDSPGEIRISFIANRMCEDDGTSSGFNVIQHYLDRRLLPKKNKKAASVTIGSGTFRSFLVGMTKEGASSDRIPLIRGTLIFRGWPE
jgi:hypothetical protein